MKHLPLTPANWSDGLTQACRLLRQHWPNNWPGLPVILFLCQRSLRLETAIGGPIVALNQFAQSVARNIEQHAKALNAEPAYHNRLHTADVLIVITTMLHIMNATGGQHEKSWASALLAATVAHDYQHPGGMNQSAFEHERASWQSVLHFAHHLPASWREYISTWILGTDVSAVADNHHQISGQQFVWSSLWCQVLLNEADIFVSATAEFGPSLSEALAREWRHSGHAEHVRVATVSGRVQFLRSIRFSSPAALALGIQQQVAEQLQMLSQQE